MGRWSQRRRCGGGFSINMMVSAAIVADEEVEITFLGPVDATQFAGTDFESQPTFFESISVGQQSARVIVVTFQDNISAETAIRYTGLVPGILTNQTIPMS